MNNIINNIYSFKGGIIKILMTEFHLLATPHRTAFDSETGLYLPLRHLLGRRMGIHLERSSQLDISYWKFKEARPYTGRIHIIPTLLDEDLTLIEDIMIGELPKDFPAVSERTTSSKEVNVSLFYPISTENWNVRIHYNYDGLSHPFRDNYCELLIAEGRLTSSFRNHYIFEDLEKVVYNPPRTRPKTLQPAAKSQ